MAPIALRFLHLRSNDAGMPVLGSLARNLELAVSELNLPGLSAAHSRGSPEYADRFLIGRVEADDPATLHH